MIIVMMGICGAGKTTIGRALAERLGIPFTEGDSFHPPENVARMKAGHPLTDADRAPWLKALATAITAWSTAGEEMVMSCSALRRSYRDQFRAAAPDVVFVHLHGAVDLVRARMATREGHFMPIALIDSQIADLEDPTGEPGVIVVDVAGTPEEIVDRIVAQLPR